MYIPNIVSVTKRRRSKNSKTLYMKIIRTGYLIKHLKKKHLSFHATKLTEKTPNATNTKLILFILLEEEK